MAEGRYHLVRHGAYERRPERLSEIGKEQVAEARDLLVDKGLGGRALILSSDLPRAIETAEIIAAGLEAPVIPSRRIGEGGNHPRGIKSLDDFIDKALGEAGETLPNDTDLVLVTHAPMLAAIMNVDVKFVAMGEVIEYTVGSWENPKFNEAYQELLEHDIARVDQP